MNVAHRNVETFFMIERNNNWVKVKKNQDDSALLAECLKIF